jgi:hypothetical protein
MEVINDLRSSSIVTRGPKEGEEFRGSCDDNVSPKRRLILWIFITVWGPDPVSWMEVQRVKFRTFSRWSRYRQIWDSWAQLFPERTGSLTMSICACSVKSADHW